MSREAIAKGFENLLARMTASQIANNNDLQGCTAAEIQTLERRYRVVLPTSYRRYLELMGHRSGRLFQSDHAVVFFNYVLEMTEDVVHRRINATDRGEVNDTIAPQGFQLPPNALIISGRLDAAWHFIQCVGPDDSPVWYFDEIDWVIEQAHASVLDWLNDWCKYTEDAIASGYFDENPLGTVP